jgi:DNA-binding NarL/FixJ family response regulator
VTHIPIALRIAVRDPRRLLAEALGVLVAQLTGFVLTDVDPHGFAAPGERPDLVLVGVPQPPAEALAMVVSLRARLPQLPVVLLADSPDHGLVGFVLDHRLNGLLVTDCSAADLAACLRQVSRGNTVLPAHWQRFSTPAPGDPLQGLSARQMDVLELLAQGLSYDEIGARLFISANTVKFHVRGIFVRLGVRNRTAAARFVAGSRGAGALQQPPSA